MRKWLIAIALGLCILPGARADEGMWLVQCLDRALEKNMKARGCKLSAREIYNEDSTLIEKFVVEDDCYYLACGRGSHCVDSRETGYFTKSRMLGRYMPEPDRVKKAITDVARKHFGKFIAPKKKQTQAVPPRS